MCKLRRYFRYERTIDNGKSNKNKHAGMINRSYLSIIDGALVKALITGSSIKTNARHSITIVALRCSTTIRKDRAITARPARINGS